MSAGAETDVAPPPAQVAEEPTGTAAAAAAPMISEARSHLPLEEDDVEDVKEVSEEGEAEEDDLFTSLEHEQEEQEAKQVEAQPKEVTAAPRLLQKALEAGQVHADESEEESEKEKEEEKKMSASQQVSPEKPHIHQRVSTILIFFCVGVFSLLLTFVALYRRNDTALAIEEAIPPASWF